MVHHPLARPLTHPTVTISWRNKGLKCAHCSGNVSCSELVCRKDGHSFRCPLYRPRHWLLVTRQNVLVIWQLLVSRECWLGTLDHMEKHFQSIAGLAKLWTNLVVSMNCIQTFDTKMVVGRKYMPHISLVSCFTDAVDHLRCILQGFQPCTKEIKQSW